MRVKGDREDASAPPLFSPRRDAGDPIQELVTGLLTKILCTNARKFYSLGGAQAVARNPLVNRNPGEASTVEEEITPKKTAVRRGDMQGRQGQRCEE